MAYVDEMEAIDEKEAKHLVWTMRNTLKKLRSEEDSFEKKCALLQIQGFYPWPKTEDELEVVVGVLRRSAYPGRNAGIA